MKSMALLQRVPVMLIMCALGTSLARELPQLSEVSLLEEGQLCFLNSKSIHLLVDHLCAR